MSTTPNLALPYILPSQAQKHVTHNEALRRLDAVVQIAVSRRDLAEPPATADDGERLIVAAPAGGAWAGQEGRVAAWQDGAWAFLEPRAGWLAWVEAEEALAVYDGAAWTSPLPPPVSLNPAPLVGVNAVADATNRLAVKSDAALFSHDDATPGTGDMRLTLNKAGASNTVTQLYQSGWSGRAETGLAGNDDFHVKVSPDGATWREAIVIDRTTGAVSIPRPASPWKGRKWAALGGDITAEGQYATPLAGLIEADLVNLAVAGATLAGSVLSAQIPLIPADADLVTLEAGSNDFPSGLALGGPGDVTSASFHGALHAALDAIANRAPGALIALITPWSAGPKPDGTLPPPAASRTHFAVNGATTLRQWQQAVRDVAALTGWPLLDAGRDGGLGYWTAGEYTTDGVRPNAAGGERLARFLADRLLALRPRAGGFVPVAVPALDPAAKGSNAVLTNGGRELSTLVSAWTSARGAQGRNAGQHYFEARLVVLGAPLNTLVGVADATTAPAGLNSYPGGYNHGVAVRGDRLFNNANTVVATQAATPAYTAQAGDTIMVAVDFAGGSVWFGRNGAWFTGTPAPGSTAGRNASFAPGLTLYPALGVAGATNRVGLAANAAEQIYVPPSGFSAWG